MSLANGFVGMAALKQHGKDDFLASIVVFLVALPLCMGIAIASGAPPAAGLITGIIGGLIVGALSGSPLQVSGPAAGLAVIIYQLIQDYGFPVVGVIVLLAGMIQMAAGLLKLGQWFRAVSPAVIQGMLAGIGVLIFASQFHVMVDDRPKESGWQNLLSIPEAVWKGLVPLDGSPHHLAALVGAITILTILAWRAFAPKRIRFIPAPLVAVCLATMLAALSHFDISYIKIDDNLFGSLALPSAANLGRMFELSIVLAAVGVAAVASAETLLCATAVDKMHSDTKARTKYDRELTAQGIGNVLCGALGGLPMTGVIVRSAANVEAGGRTRLSAMLHGLWILIFVFAFPSVLRTIPTASLAAMLVYTGYKLVNVQAIRNLWTHGKSEVAIYAVTVGVIVGKDLLTGVITGIVLSALKLLYTFSHLRIRLVENPQQNRTELQLIGAATFIRLPQLAAALERIKPNTELHVSLDRLDYIDHACLDLLVNWEKQHQTTGGMLIVDWGTLHAKFRDARRGHAKARGAEPAETVNGAPVAVSKAARGG